MVVVYINNYPVEFTDEKFKEFKKQYKVIKAAGGLVYNDKNELLVIFRNGKWDIPKGKAEDGESIAETAVREVQEECGLEKVKITNPTPITTYHTYNLKGKEVLKKTYWFQMISNDTKTLIPQLEEGITEVCWVKKKFIETEMLLNTYSSVKYLIVNHYL